MLNHSLLVLLSTTAAVGLLLLASLQLRIGHSLASLTHDGLPLPLLDLPSTSLRLGQFTSTNTIHIRITTNTTLDIHSTLARRLSPIEARLLRPLLSSATIHTSAPILIFRAGSGHQLPLLELTLQHPLILRLASSPALTAIDLLLRFPHPSQLPPLLSAKPTSLRLSLRKLHLRLNNPHSGTPLNSLFYSLARLSLPTLSLHLPLTLPKIPNGWADPAKLLRIVSYEFFPLPSPNSPRMGVGIRATVSAPNPLLELRRHIRELRVDVAVPWPIPLAVLLVQQPDTASHSHLAPLAATHTLPFLLDPASESLALSIEGFLLPSLSNTTQEDKEDPLSGFLNKFLAGKPNALAVKYAPPSPQPVPVHRSQRPFSLARPAEVPTLISAFLVALDLRLQFPGTSTRDLIQSLELQDLRIHIPFTPGSQLRCSGTLKALVVLPRQLRGLSSLLDIRLFRPDVLLLDGPLPPEEEDALPPNAFARLAPSAYIPALLLHPATPISPLILTAILDHQPLLIPPNRKHVFRNYAAKYVLHHRKQDSPAGAGVLTSVRGHFDASALLARSFPLTLTKVAVQGSFLV